MTEYRRYRISGATWFFTVNLAERKGNRLLVDRVGELRAAFAKVKAEHPFHIEAIVVLPDHLHGVWRLPDGDTDFSTRWSLVKAGFSRHIEKGERVSASRDKRGERGLWQRRFWEHRIRDDKDYWRHIDYIHWNPVKHGLVRSVKDWPYSSFHVHVRRGHYSEDWGSDVDSSNVMAGERRERCGSYRHRILRAVPPNAYVWLETACPAPGTDRNTSPGY